MKLIAAAFLLLFYLSANGQNSLSGTITDSLTKEPLVGAVVFFPELKQGSSTGVNGDFTIDHLPAGNFLLEVKFLGYTSFAGKVDIKGKTVINIGLDPSATEIHELVITGVSSSTPRKMSPVPTLVINRDFLNQSAQTNIVDAIARKPGIAQISSGAAISKPVIRGLGYNRVVTLNNGIRQEGQQWGDEHGIEIDEYSIDRIEIIKGPGSLMYGSDAIGGVVNFLLPDPVEQGKVIGNILANYQTNNGLIGYSLMNAGNRNGLNWSLRLSSKNAGSYSNRYDGRVFNSGFNELNMNGYIGINRKWGYTQLHVSTFNQSVGLVGGERDSLGRFIKEIPDVTDLSHTKVIYTSIIPGKARQEGLSVPRQTINHMRVASISNFILGRSSVKLNLAFQQNDRKEFGDAISPAEPGIYFKLNTFNYDAKYFLPSSRSWETTLGVNGMIQSNRNPGKEFIIPSYDIFDGGVFVFAKKTFKRLHLSGGVRADTRRISIHELYLDFVGSPAPAADTNDLKFSAAERNFANFSGSFGASYNFSSMLTVKLNIARGYRAPNASELSANGRHEGTFRYELGNIDLKAETSLQGDAGLLFNSRHISLEMAVFNNSISNYIFAAKLLNSKGQDSIVDPSDPAPAFKFSQGNADLFGGEISLDIHPHPLDWLHFQNSFSLVRGMLRDQSDSTKYLPFMPAPRYQSEVRASVKKWGKRLKNLYVNAEFDYFFKQDQVYSANRTETPTPAYYLLNAGTGADFLRENGSVLFSLYIVAANLTDAAYQNHLSRLKYAPQNPFTGRNGVYNMGRNVSVKLLLPLRFGKKKQT